MLSNEQVDVVMNVENDLCFGGKMNAKMLFRMRAARILTKRNRCGKVLVGNVQPKPLDRFEIMEVSKEVSRANKRL